MKKIFFKKVLSILMATVMGGCAAISVNAFGANEARFADDNATQKYAAETDEKMQEIAYGKIFRNGKNEVVDDSSKLDTYISALEFYDSNETYVIEFDFGDTHYVIKGDLVSAKMNNVNNDHFVFAPNSKMVGEYEIVNISYSQVANKYDLLPVNVDKMVGKPVITIIITDGQDVYYWQTVISLNNGISAFSSNNESLRVCSDERKVDIANEFYFMNGNEQFEINIHSDEIMDVSEISESYFESDIDTSVFSNRVKSARATENNPYYDYGVPNSTFQTVNSSWTWRSVSGNPWRCYRYTYEKYGSNNLYTSIVLLEVIKDLPQEYEERNINGEDYNVADTLLQIKMILPSNTVIYYPDEDMYDLMPGGEDLIMLDKPVLEVVKDSSGVEHFVYGRFNYARGTKSDYVSTAVDALASIAVKLIDEYTGNIIASTIYELADIFSGAVYEIGDNPALQYEHYLTQKIGSMKNTLDGYLHLEGHYYGMKCELAAPSSSGDAVLECFWNITTNIKHK